MSKVSRSIYQKAMEENKQLKKDIRTLVDGKSDSIILRMKYRKQYEKERKIHQDIKDAVGFYIKENKAELPDFITENIK